MCLFVSESEIRNRINYTRILDTENSSAIQNDDEFPLVSIKNGNEKEEKISNRIGFLIVNCSIFWLIITFKSQLINLVDIPQFCDIMPDWSKNPNLSDNTCLEKCTNSAYLFSKLLQFNWYLNYPFVNSYGYYFTNLFRKTWLSYILGPSALPFTILGHIIFFKIKSLALAIGVIFTVFGNVILIFVKWKFFKIAFSLSFVRFYFIIIKLFFTFAYPEIFAYFPDLCVKILPIFLYFLKKLYDFMTKTELMNRYSVFLKMNINICLITFEFINLGCVHEVIHRKNIWAIEVWINMLFTFMLDLDKKVLLLKRLYNKSMNFIFKKNYILDLNDYEAIYVSQKIELEIFSRFVYFSIIFTKYFDFADTSLVDCYGKPSESITTIKLDHFYMCLFHFSSIILQMVARYFVIKIFKLEKRSFFPKFKNFYYCHSYLGYYIGMCISMGLPCFYIMISINNIK